MKTLNFLDEVSGAGLYFITSGEVKKAISKEATFTKIVNPQERMKSIDRLSKTIEREVNAEIKRKVTPLIPRKSKSSK